MKQIFIVMVLSLLLLGCSHNDDDNGPIIPGDNEDAVFNEPQPTKPPVQRIEPDFVEEWDGPWNEVEGSYESPTSSVIQAARGCSTYTSTRISSGRRLWKINKPLWKYARTASVRFSSGYRMNVILAKANRTKAGAVVRPGSTTKNIVAIWAPYRDKSTRVTVCLK